MIKSEASKEVAATNAVLAAKGGTSNRPIKSVVVKAKSPVQQTKATAKSPDPATPIQVARANVQAKLQEGVGVTLHTNGSFIKGLAAEPVVARPQRKMLRVIEKIIGHPGKGNCIKRFHLYKEGMTLLDCKMTAGLIPSDVTFYAELGYLKLREPTDEEYNAAVKAWEQGKATNQAKVA